jgi:hypothetical protein
MFVCLPILVSPAIAADDRKMSQESSNSHKKVTKRFIRASIDTCFQTACFYYLIFATELVKINE